VEDFLNMKKLSLSIMSALLLGALLVLPNTASAQDEAQQAFEREWYDTCYTKKDMPKCVQMSKELKAKYPNSTYIKNATGIVTQDEITKAWEAFQAALKDYYSGAPDATKLEKLFSTGDTFLALQPNYPDVVAQQALAAQGATLSEAYKNFDKAKSYAEKALALFEAPNTPNKEQMDQARWTQFRELVQALGNQLLGFIYSQPGGDPQKALEYLNKAIAVKASSGMGWKDPNNYWLRSTINNAEYVKLSKEYGALTDEEKTGEKGKALLKQIGAAVDKVLPDYARVIVTATKPEYKGLQDAARETFTALWKFRTGVPEQAEAYIKNYAADPTIADVAVPAKAEDAPPPAPATNTTQVKLSAGGSGGAPGGAAANGTKATTTKGKAKAAPTKKKGRR
jgi:tetratricopeptide (TPR) repeat protein